MGVYILTINQLCYNAELIPLNEKEHHDKETYINKPVIKVNLHLCFPILVLVDFVKIALILEIQACEVLYSNVLRMMHIHIHEMMKILQLLQDMYPKF